MRIRRLLLIVLTVTAPVTFAVAQGDTVYVPPADTTFIDTVPPDTLAEPDSLTAARQALLDFAKRREEFKQSEQPRVPALSLIDSVSTYFASERLNQRSRVDASFYHDAGDYFRFDPSYFVIDYQSTPMRKTVQPFGLSSGRVNVIANRLPVEPFEHTVEPDGLVDFNDIPTALDSRVYVIPGPTGRLFGGKQVLATLVTLPEKTESTTPQSAFLVDQGSFEYNFVRGRFSKVFANRREIDLSIGYRNSDGATLGTADDVYHYTGRFYWPMGQKWAFRASGRLYDREGLFAVQPNLAGSVLKRDRIDRSAEMAVQRADSAHTSTVEFGYRYLKQKSHIDGGYKGRFNINGDGVFLAREWISGSSTIVRAELRGDMDEYIDGFDSFERSSGQISLRLVRLGSGWRLGGTAAAEYVEDRDWLPSVSVSAQKETGKALLLLSIGYASRAPSLHELHLRFQRTSVYDGVDLNYADQGNPDLKTERQLVASAVMELGSPDNNIRLSLTGGTIFDGIEWNSRRLTDSVGVPYRLFSPVNSDLDFINATVAHKLKLGSLITLTSGGTYRRVDFEVFADKPYLPEYQLFSGAELHVYWPQKIMHLYVYGEVDYVGPYRGHDRTGLGERLVANLKLSFRIKAFRFHYVFQNLLATVFEPHEYISNPGRFSYFGLTWGFLD
ncbi:MAG: hypothetical protein JSW34_13625 [Candidatus Zixiibacteriota bacterium]|nr:MAG: hypothetical protein JSW34_13625 [candidate division Zixibacteria bacterium]